MKSWWEFGEYRGRCGKQPYLGFVTCAFCGTKGHFNKVCSRHKISASSNKTLNYDTMQCENCGNLTFMFWSTNRSGDHYAYKTLPFPLAQREAPEHWDEDIKRYWEQAHSSLHCRNWDAAAVMARSALHVVVKEQKASGKNLVDQIGDLREKGVLPKIMVDFAHEVRLLGNESAHPAPERTATQEDAAHIIEFLDILLNYVYNLPKKINDYRARRKAP